MIQALEKAFKDNDRDVDALAHVLMAFVVALVGRAIFFIYEESYQDLWALMPLAVPLLAALAVVRVANRLLISGHMVREDERRQDLVRTTHHLIAITTDLRQRVGYFRKLMSEGGRPPIVLIKAGKSIEARYEALLDRDGYRFLPGNCVDVITRISGHIFGLSVIAEALEQGTSGKPEVRVTNLPIQTGEPSDVGLDAVMTDLQILLDELFKLRRSITSESSGA